MVLNVPVRAQGDGVSLKIDGSGGDELVARPKLLVDATACAWSPTRWVSSLDAADAGSLAAGRGLAQAGDPIEQTLAGKPSQRLYMSWTQPQAMAWR